MPSRTSQQLPLLWIATRNRGKTREFRSLLAEVCRVRDLHAMANFPEIKETGRTFRANARIKALALSRCLPHQLILADDSGLVVPSLQGRPGVRSARFAGPNATEGRNLDKLLRLLRNRPRKARKAYFQAALVLALDGRVLVEKGGRIWGYITEKGQGISGFGYDPAFQPLGYKKTFGQLSPKIKEQISHRAVACRELTRFLSTKRALSTGKKHI